MISLFSRRGQVDTPEEIVEKPTLGEQLLADLRAADSMAGKSDLATETIAPYQALITVAPGKGEAGGALAWTAMTIAGLLRLFGVTAAWALGQAFATRPRAAASTAGILFGILLSWVAGYQSPTP